MFPSYVHIFVNTVDYHLRGEIYKKLPHYCKLPMGLLHLPYSQLEILFHIMARGMFLQLK